MRIYLFLIAFILSSLFWWGANLFQKNLERFFYANIGQPFEEMIIVQVPEKVQKPPLELNVKSAISLKINKTGKEKILFQKNPEEILPIASLTKLMTAIIILDLYPSDLENTWITVSPEAANQENVPLYGNLMTGERFNLKKLLNLTLIYSSNDSAFALAEVIGLENFVERMNQKTKELGLKNTHFINPTGLDPENLYYHLPNREYFNYSTAKDLGVLAKSILKDYPIIFDISLKKESFPVRNGLFDLFLPENFRLIGGKTGYTLEAGECFLVVFQDEKGALFLNLILGAQKGTRIEEMQKLIDWILR